MDASQCKSIVELYVERWNAGDIDGVVALLSDDFRLRGMGMPKSGIDHDIGREDLRANAQNYERRRKPR